MECYAVLAWEKHHWLFLFVFDKRFFIGSRIFPKLGFFADFLYTYIVFRVNEYKKTGVCSARARSAAKPYLSIIAFNIAIIFDELHTIEYICILDKSQIIFAVIIIGSTPPLPSHHSQYVRLPYLSLSPSSPLGR